MRKLKVGVIGVGAMGKHHARVYSEIANAELVGVADVNEKVAREVAQTYNTEAFTDYEELLNRGLDAVSIAVPTSLHKDVALRVAEFGVDMLIEKPIAESLSSAEKILKAARREGVKVMVGHIERFNPAVLKLKELILAGELGEVLTMSSKRVGPYSPRIRDVGIIIDLAVHDIDTISYLYGERAVSVYAVAGNSFHTNEDYASLLIKFDKNRAGLIETNWLTPKKVRTLTAVGTGGVATLDYIEQSLKIHKNGEEVEVGVQKREPLRNELEAFLECVAEDKPPEPSGEDGMYVLSVAVSAITSYKAGKLVELDKIELDNDRILV
ncbi:MAG: gfo/Idh/MocA family oxidoreductase [Archaeoglobales archaeon]|nr:MAG: gfo/Idh/MocA family oxidoreductase [Archaeoglobales archaeon]